MSETQDIATRLREATTVLDEPFHWDAVAVTIADAATLIEQHAAQLAEYTGHDLVCNADRHTPPSCSCLGRARREVDAARAQIAAQAEAIAHLKRTLDENGAYADAKNAQLAEKDAEIARLRERAEKYAEALEQIRDDPHIYHIGHAKELAERALAAQS